MKDWGSAEQHHTARLRAYCAESCAVPLPRNREATVGTAARILVADDKPADVQALVGPLEEAGYEVLTVDNGFTVAHVAAERQPDLIMLAAAPVRSCDEEEQHRTPSNPSLPL